MSSLRLDRKTLASFLPDRKSILAFEKLFVSVEEALPDGVEAATALAYTASAIANMAVAMLTEQAGQIEQLSFLPAVAPAVQDDEYRPAFSVGTLSQQNAESVEITGGTINGTAIGATSASTGAFTTLNATGQITSALATGTAPLVVASTTKVANLNADLLDGTDWAAPGTIGGTTPASAAFTSINASGQITSTLASGTAPLVVASTTQVANLNVSQLIGGTWAIPGAIGLTTKNSGAFTTLSSSGQALLNGVATTGTGFGTIGTGNALFKSYNGGSPGISVGASGGNYGEVGYNIDFQSVSGTYKYLVADTAGAIQFSGANILLKGAAAGAAGAALTLDTWATIKSTGIESTPVGATTASTVRGSTVQSVGAFGCNGAAVQTPAASGGAMATTAATNVSPYGFATAEQADSIATKLNAIRAALVANGIMS